MIDTITGFGDNYTGHKDIFRVSTFQEILKKRPTASDKGTEVQGMITPAISLFSLKLMFFHILVLKEYWVLTERRIPRKPVLGGVKIVALSISTHEQTQ